MDSSTIINNNSTADTGDTGGPGDASSSVHEKCDPADTDDSAKVNAATTAMPTKCIDFVKVVTVILFLSCIGLYDGDEAWFGISHLSTSFQSCFRFLDIKSHGTVHESFWPFNLVVTFAILNGVRGHSTARHWCGNIINAVFQIFGGLIVNDVLKATPLTTFAFW